MGKRIETASSSIMSALFFLVMIFSFLLLNLILPTLGKRMNGKIISGIYSEQLSLPHFYESYIPVILEYKTPKWNKTEVTFNNWYNCTGERIPYVLSCPISFHLNSAIENLHTDFESLQPGKDEDSHLNTDHYDTLTSQSDFCHQIQNHFTSIYTHTVDFDKYLEKLEKCSRAKLGVVTTTTTSSGSPTTTTPSLFHIERNMTDYMYSVRARYSRMETNFYDTFYRPLSTAAMAAKSINDTNTLTLVAASVLSNSRTALQGSLLGHFYGERNRWTHAISSCQAHILPSSLVNETKLRSVLTDINKSRYFQLGFRLAIPLEFISKYFTLPLTDCTHTIDVFVVRLLVPVIRDRGDNGNGVTSFSLRRVRNVPFLVKNRNKICQLRNIQDEGTYLFDSVSLTAYVTNCKSNEPCDVSSSRLSGKIDVCASMIFAHRIDLIIQYCDLACHDHIRPPFPGVMVQQIANNKFALAGHDPLKLICRLNEAETETIDIDLNQTDYGGYELVLNCDCQLIISESSSSSVMQSGMLVPCEQVEPYYQIFQTVPWHFLRSEKKDEIHDLIVGKFHIKNSTANNNNNRAIEEQPVQVELFNENHLDNLLDLDYIDDLVTRSEFWDTFLAPTAPEDRRTDKTVKERNTMSKEYDDGSNNFNWLFIPLVILVAVLCVGQIFLLYQVNKIRGNPYFSLHNSVLYKSTTTPSLVAQEHESL